MLADGSDNGRILLRDRGLFDLADQEVVRGNELYRSAAAAQILTWRHQVLSELEHRGVLALDTFPEETEKPLPMLANTMLGWLCEMSSTALP